MKKENSTILLADQLSKAIVGVQHGKFILGKHLCRDIYDAILGLMHKKKLPRLTSKSIEFQETVFKVKQNG
jgi:hypothetical protein